MAYPTPIATIVTVLSNIKCTSLILNFTQIGQQMRKVRTEI